MAGFQTGLQRTLVVHTAFLGDVLLLVPLLKHLRKLQPENHRIELVARAGVATVLKKLNLIDELFEIQKGDRQSYRSLSTQLRMTVYDQIFCPHPSLRSALFVRGLQAKEKIAFAKSWNFLFFNRRIPKPKSLPEPLRLLALLTTTGQLSQTQFEHFANQDWNLLKQFQLPMPDPELAMSCKSLIKQKFTGQPWFNSRPFVVIFPGSQWETKRWKESSFADLANRLQKKFHVYWMGAPSERSLCEKLAALSAGTDSMAGRISIEQTYRLLAEAHLVISNDSGGTHMAALAGSPVLTIFGPTVLTQGFRPWSQGGNWVAQLEGLSCRPCGAHGHHSCPIKTHACMRDLKVEHVAEIAAQALSARQSP